VVLVGVPVEPGARGHGKGRHHHGRAAIPVFGALVFGALVFGALVFGALVFGALSGSRHNMAAYALGPRVPRA
jgi:hypothetical protein